MPAKPKSPEPIAIALQGGGSHGAFAWGALDQLLLDDGLSIQAVSATSGGALTAAVLAQGLMDGGKDGARQALETLWRKISIAAGMLPLKITAVDKFLSHVGIDLSPSSLALDYLTRVFSPSQFNLFDINPLRGIIEEMVDFRALTKHCPVDLFINATHAKTGESKIFTAETLSLDAVMASACLPFIFKTVEVRGEPYWDGAFSGCPPLAPLAEGKYSQDIVLIQTHPAFVEDVPTTATDILDRALEMAFASLLAQEIRYVEAVRKNTRIHRIAADETLVSLGRASKLTADWDFLVHLHDLGVQAATDWTEQLRKR